MAPYVRTRSNAEHSPSRRRWCSSEGRTLRARSTSLEAYNGGGGGWCCGTASAKGSVRQIWRTAKRITALSSFKLLALLTLAPTAVHGGWEFTDLNETCSSACAKVKRVCTNNNRLAFANQCGSPKTITDALARSNLTSITCEPYQHWPTDTRVAGPYIEQNLTTGAAKCFIRQFQGHIGQLEVFKNDQNCNGNNHPSRRNLCCCLFADGSENPEASCFTGAKTFDRGDLDGQCDGGHYFEGRNSSTLILSRQDTVCNAPRHCGFQWCKLCPSGRFQPRQVLLQIQGVESSEANLVGTDSCSPCARGTYSAEKGRVLPCSLLCPACPHGKAQTTLGATSLADCNCATDDNSWYMTQPDQSCNEVCKALGSVCAETRLVEAASTMGRGAFLPILSDAVGNDVDCRPAFMAELDGKTPAIVDGKCYFNGHANRPMANDTCSWTTAGRRGFCCCGGSNDTAGARRSQCALGFNDCRKGTYYSGGRCIHCPVGFWSTSINSTSKDTCEKCAPGRWSGTPGLGSNCTACVAARYSSQEGRTTACTNGCIKGRYGNKSGSTSEDRGCALCEEGRWCSAFSSHQSMCSSGRYSAMKGLWDDAQCTECQTGRFSVMPGRTSACDICAAGKYQNERGKAVCLNCSAGRFANVSAPRVFDSDCKGCPTGRFSNASGATNATTCNMCQTGKFSLHSAASVCHYCAAGKYQDLQGTSGCKSCGKGYATVVETFRNCSGLFCNENNRPNATHTGATQLSHCVAQLPHCLNFDTELLPTQCKVPLPSLFGKEASTDYAFGARFAIGCYNLGKCDISKDRLDITCGPNLEFMPAASKARFVLDCGNSRCTLPALPPATQAWEYGHQIQFNTLQQELTRTSPAKAELRCSDHASMFETSPAVCNDNNTVLTESAARLSLQCPVWSGGNWLIRNSNESFDTSSAKTRVCRCNQGFALNAKDQSMCRACKDDTYAPLNECNERTECRVCPFEGVSCLGGVLQLDNDVWFNVAATNAYNIEGKRGIDATTTIYPCTMREACLLNASAIPMTMYCHENHTGVLCSRCYNRRVSCGRDAAVRGVCESPDFFQRDPQWMYFATIARHCVRCPAGEDAIYSYVATVAIILLVSVCLMILVSQRLHNVWKRLEGKQRSNAGGAMRLFLNWLQMVTMLSSTKLQPPQEVKSSLAAADYFTISLEWYPVQCALHLTYYSRIVIYMILPIISLVMPLIYVGGVYIVAGQTARCFNRCKRICKAARRARCKCLPQVKRNKTTEKKGKFSSKDAESSIEHDLEAGARRLRRHRREKRTSLDPVECTFFECVASKPVMLRAGTNLGAKALPYVIRPGDVVRADGVVALNSVHYIKLCGKWGDGYVFDHMPIVGEILRPISSMRIVNPDASVEASQRDEVQHVFNTIAALSGAPLQLITLTDVVLALPSRSTDAEANDLLSTYDVDGDGALTFSEFQNAHQDFRSKWRFEHIFEAFAHANVSKTGLATLQELEESELFGASSEEIVAMTATLTSGEKVGDCNGVFLTISAFTGMHHALRMDAILLAVATTFVMSTYLLYSKVTKALLTVFSFEEVDGSTWLKLDMGTIAFDNQHIAMMCVAGIGLFIFSGCIPLVALWLMHAHRYRMNERKVKIIAGFVTDGYREGVAWFWEFIILARKLGVVVVALFIPDSFLQSWWASVLLCLSITIHIAVRPYQMQVMNVLEFASLSCVLMTQLAGILLWYLSIPGHASEYIYVYDGLITVLLIVCNASVAASFGVMVIGFTFKHNSMKMLDWLPSTRPLFERLRKIDSDLYWYLFSLKLGEGDWPEWSFAEASITGKKGTGAKTRKKFQNAVQAVEEHAHTIRTSSGAKAKRLRSILQRPARAVKSNVDDRPEFNLSLVMDQSDDDHSSVSIIRPQRRRSSVVVALDLSCADDYNYFMEEEQPSQEDLEWSANPVASGVRRSSFAFALDLMQTRHSVTENEL